ncbi:DER1-domain-containing protein [Amylostereum chailletii]|nr:DER1-domain-containing protein [Amylostereum chailletii]
MSFADFGGEIRKIPPVTRFLCVSSVAVSVPVMLQLVRPMSVVFVRQLVTQRLQIWRIWSSFFLGSQGITYIFDLAMLYHRTNSLEAGYYPGRSADLAWQLLVACGSIIALNLPLHSFLHKNALTLCLAYVEAALAPPGTQTSIMGLLRIPVVYLPYFLIFVDLIQGGTQAAAQSITGAIVGHLWWMLLFGNTGRAGLVDGQRWGKAPRWLQRIMGEGEWAARPDSGPAPMGAGGSGVYVQPPRRPAAAENPGGDYRWGTGNRLGTE